MEEFDSSESQASLSRPGGPGPFVTHCRRNLPSGRHLVATSRRHRKGLPPHQIETVADVTTALPTHAEAFGHLWAPGRLGWWVALLFAVGSIHFMLGAVAATWPRAAPVWLSDSTTLGWIFFVGSIFFTSAAWLQWLEALNADVTKAFGDAPRRWQWFGWRPHDLGYLASAIQLVGTLLFNFNTADAMIGGLTWVEQDVLIWTPNMLGSICFLVASLLAYAEVTHGAASNSPRSVSWWIAIVNLTGSVAFQLSAFVSYVGPTSPSASMLFWSTFWTAAGALCFLVGAYLLVPELFDTD